MANTIAIAQGFDSSRIKRVTRLGSERALVHANTWGTFASAEVDRAGAGAITVRRDGHKIEVYFGTEDQPLLSDYTLRIDGRVITLADVKGNA